MGYKLVSNSYSKTSLPSLKIQFDSDFEQDKFVDHMGKLEFDGINWVKVTGVVDVVGVRGGADPATAIANLLTQTISWIRAGRAKKNEMEIIDTETSALEPVVARLFEMYPFVRNAFAQERLNIIARIESAKGKKKDPFFKQLNSLLKSVIQSIKPISPMLSTIEFITNTPVAPMDFTREFAEYFKQNPSALPPSPTSTPTTNSQKNTSSNAPTGTSILPYLFGGLILYSIMQQPTKKGKSSKR